MNNVEELEEALSRPSTADVEALGKLDGDLLIVGASGKMGPSLTGLAKRSFEQAGVKRRVVAAARFSAAGSRELLEKQGIETAVCDLLDRESIARLPDCANVVYMAGFKFGSASHPSITWATNTYASAMVAERFRDSRMAAFSTGNVYPLTAPEGGGPREEDPIGPIGEYAQSALGRERMFEYFSAKHGTPTAILRLNYAIEPRYGVLRDIADKVRGRRPIDLSMGYVNVIWQRDANSIALRSLAHCSSPPLVLNMTGAETLRVRELAEKFGKVWGIEPIFEGGESPTALLSNAARCREMFGPCETGIDQMIEWIAAWVAGGGGSLGKPTHFEEREGKF